MKQTKEVLDLAVSLVTAYRAAKKDGKFNAMDVQYLIDPALKIAPAFDKIEDVPKEWTNLKETDIEGLLAYVRQINPDPEFVKLVYHVIGMGAAVVALTK